MPLIKPVLELQILTAFQKMSNAETDMATAQQDLAKALATAIDSYIKSATVTVTPGQVVVGTAGPVPVAATTTTPGIAIIS
jgi:hypothetical protein